MVKPLNERVRESEARKVQDGGRRMPGGVLGSKAARALERLQAAGYASSATSCIARALLEAEQRLNKHRPKG